MSNVASQPRSLSQAPQPPRREVINFWSLATALTLSRMARRWAQRRGLDPETLEELDLVRVLPNRKCAPPWMKGAQTGCVQLQLFDSEGEEASVRLRNPKRPGYRGVPKGYSTKGLVMANEEARAMLRGELVPERVIVVEGEIDFLTVAMLAKDLNIAVIGISSGSWTAGIASRIPSRTLVQVWTDHDAAGQRYAEKVARTLHPRCLVVRSLAREEDINELWMKGELSAELELAGAPWVPAAPKREATKVYEAPKVERREMEEKRREGVRAKGLELVRRALEMEQRHDCALRVGQVCGNFVEYLTGGDVEDAEQALLAKFPNDPKDSRRTFHDGLRYGSAPERRYVPADRPAPRPKAKTSDEPKETARGLLSAGPVEVSSDVFEFCAKYVESDWLMGLADGVIKLHCPHGTGKTTAIAALLKAMGDDSGLYISPRTELCRTAGSRDMGLSFYKDEDVNVGTAERLSICLDSIRKIRLCDENGEARSFKVLVLDEVEQLTHHMFGGTIGAASYQVFDHLRILMQEAECVVLSDADIGPMTEALLRSVFYDVEPQWQPKVRTLRNTYQHDRTAHLVQNKQECFAQLLHALIRGEKVAAACTSAKMAERLNAMVNGQYLDCEGSEVRTLLTLLREKRPNLKTLLVTSDNKGEDDVKAFMPDPDKVVGEYDAVFFSSVIGTGYSINARGFRCFLFAAANGPQHGLNAHGALQMLWRFRNPLDDSWTVWAEQTEYHEVTDEADMRRALLVERTMTTNIVTFRTRRGPHGIERHAHDDAHLDLYLTVRTRHNALSNRLRGELRKHMGRHGVRLIDVEPELDDNTVKALRNVEKGAKQGLIDEECDALGETRDEPRDEALIEEINRRGPENKSERRVMDLDRVERALGDTPKDEDLREFVESNGACISRGRRLAMVLIVLAGNPDIFARLAENVNLRSSFATHLQAGMTRALALAQLLLVAGLKPNALREFSVNAPDLRQTVVPWVMLNRDLLKATGLNTDAGDLESSPTKLVSSALKRLGLGFEKARQARDEGKQVRFYDLDAEQLERAMRWARAPLKEMAPELTVTDPWILLNHAGFCDSEPPLPRKRAA